jgi:hypothetical protein
MINKDFGWFKYGSGAIPNLSRCNFAEQGILLAIACHYLKYNYTFPADLAFELSATQEEVDLAWTVRAQWCWPYVKRYLEDERDTNLAKREAVAEVRKKKAAAKKEEERIAKEQSKDGKPNV